MGIVCFCGPDGSGKSSVAKEIARKFNLECVRFPGHTKFGADLREMLLNPQSKVSKKAAFFGFLTDMMHTIDNLDMTKNYVFDRYMYSTFVYQIATSGQWTAVEQIRLKGILEEILPSPDLTFVLDCDVVTSRQRLITTEFKQPDKYEAEPNRKWEQRRNWYRSLHTSFPQDKFVMIDTSDLSQTTVTNMVTSLIEEKLKWSQ